MDERVARRTVVVALAGAALTGGCGSRVKTKSVSEVDGADADVLDGLLQLEHLAVAAYAHAASQLSGTELALAHRVGGQEGEHAKLLTHLVGTLSGRPSPPRRDYGFPALRDRSAALRFASDVENSAIAAYIDALPKISNGLVRGTAASIAANEAQHVAVIAGVRGLTQTPVAIVMGRP